MDVKILDPSPPAGGGEASLDRPDPCAVGGAEHPAACRAMFGPEACPLDQRRGGVAVDRNRPPFARLGVSTLQMDQTAVEIDAVPFQTQQLAPAHPGVKGQPDEIRQVRGLRFVLRGLDQRRRFGSAQPPVVPENS